MGNKLNFIAARENLPLVDIAKNTNKKVPLEQIELHPKFRKLFEINEEVLKRIVESMKENGFDRSQSLHIWKYKGHYYLIDGYTRLKASELAGITTVPVYEHDFETYEEAYKYALSLQVNRRNLDSSDVLKNVQLLMGSKFVKNYEGNKADLIAETLGVSKRTALRAIAVEKKADKKQRKKIEKGEMLINQVYNELSNSEKKENRNQVYIKEVVKKAVEFVLARIESGCEPAQLIQEEDYKALLQNPCDFDWESEKRSLS